MATNRGIKVRRNLPRGPHGGVELLLIQNVEHLGKQGQVVEVKPGYAKNFLLPQGLATFASDHHKRMIEKHKARLAEIQRLRMADLKARADKISSISVTIEANAMADGHLYGSVGPYDIVAALKAKGVTDVTADMIRLQGPLKEAGLYKVRVHVATDIDAEMDVWVIPTGGPDQGDAPEAK